MEITISQSFNTAFYDEDRCDYATFAEFFLGWERPTTETMLGGQVFEYHLTGAKNRKGEVPKMKRGKNGGGILVDEERIIAYALEEKARLAELGIDLSTAIVAPHITYSIYEGHFDLMWILPDRIIIKDVKLTKLSRHEMNPETGWGNPSNKKLDQSIWYPWLAHKKYNLPVEFEYLVYGLADSGKNKWMIRVPVILSEDTFANHEQRLSELNTALLIWPKTIKPTDDFNMCRNCAFVDRCDKKQTVPPIIPVYI